ncbi:Short-chain dehydrogenase/reductase [marine gamma proteobacterium HTCC2143]|jgi:NAD(P)-dependent dehydrogenase (short-subunit alcohol dehydrogenase family)|uniref:Short-chain dehydrogenase/reductase n=1 Tax=marine gamma proteobacterium HTCC2143 TaxID=247633 RepID=A0YA77_9GAMM|nr:Short-chain dehydrogenase/reductase [marine gamma proteobacterium HTCC2143]
MTNRLQGKVAIITGGTSGIGEATADIYIKEGATVVLTGRSEEKGQAIANRLGDKAHYIKADVSKEEDIANTISETVERFGKLDVLFNNAGGPVGGTIDSIAPGDINYGVDLLLSSVVLGIRYAIEPMKANGGGVIINNTSIAAIRYRQGNLLYSALKAAVTHYTKLAGVELGPLGIRVNCISPGAIATPIFWGGSAIANTKTDEDNARKLEKLKANLAKATPLQIPGLAEDIANGALFLASDEGRFINSHDLVIDGGRTSMFNE